MDKLKELVKIINEAKYLVFFGGAGVSTESDLRDFRSDNGIYVMDKYHHSSEELLSLTFFQNHPSTFFDYFFNEIVVSNAIPNDAHRVLTKLEKSGKLKAIITQNIDGLHQLSGSKNVYELHGSSKKFTCVKCHKKYDLNTVINEDIPRCDCNGIIKPDIVLYGESLDDDTISEACDQIAKADVLIVGGTSLMVHPAASLLFFFNGKKIVLINKEETPYDEQADLIINQKIGEVFKEIEKEIL